MKTIKQIADDMGVTKQAVFKKIDNLGLRDKLMKNGNQFTVDEETEALIKQGSSENNRKQVDDNDSSTVNALIDMLQRELDSKNKTIAELTETIKKQGEALEQANKALATAQALHAGTIQTQLIEQKAPAPAEPAEEPKKKRKWFWSKEKK